MGGPSWRSLRIEVDELDVVVIRSVDLEVVRALVLAESPTMMQDSARRTEIYRKEEEHEHADQSECLRTSVGARCNRINRS